MSHICVYIPLINCILFLSLFYNFDVIVKLVVFTELLLSSCI